MSKRKAKNDSIRELNEHWQNELLFINGPSGKPLCIACENTFIEDMILTDTIKHSTRLKMKENRWSCSGLSYGKYVGLRNRKKSEDKMYLIKEFFFWRRQKPPMKLL